MESPTPITAKKGIINFGLILTVIIAVIIALFLYNKVLAKPKPPVNTI